MKKPAVIFTLCLFLVLGAYAQKANKVNDVDAIKTVIEQETKAFFEVDYQTWIDSWIHTPAAYWSFADTSGFNYYEGWKAIEIGFTDYFVTTKPSNIEIERTWQDVKVYGDGAYARFKQRIITDGIYGPEQVEIRLLEKDKNTWKILLVGVLKKPQLKLATAQHH